MSTTTPKRRFQARDVVDPEGFNAQLTPQRRAMSAMNEHNLDDGIEAAVDIDVNYADDIAWRVHHDFVDLASDVIDNAGAAPGSVTFKDDDIWVDVWTYTYESAEMAALYCTCVTQTSHTLDRDQFMAGSGLSQFGALDAMGIELAWELDGQLPSEHMVGALDTSAAAIHMERGVSGEMNATMTSAVFPAVPPGSHTIKLIAKRYQAPDTFVGDREVRISTIEPLLWEIGR